MESRNRNHHRKSELAYAIERLNPEEKLAFKLIVQSFADSIARPVRNKYGKLYLKSETRQSIEFFTDPESNLSFFCGFLNINASVVLDFYKKFVRVPSTRKNVHLFKIFFINQIKGGHDAENK